MPSVPASVLLAVGDDTDMGAIGRLVPRSLEVGPVQVAERTLMDTFDGRLRRQQLTLWRERDRRAGTARLTLETSGGPSLTAAVLVQRPDRIMGQDLPDGLLAERLRPVIAERALLPAARIRVRTQNAGVCNRDGKTVVRLNVEDGTMVGSSSEALGRRLRVSPVRGYENDFRRVARLLSAGDGFREAPGDLAGAAFRAAGVYQLGSTDVDVELWPAMRTDQATILICCRLAEIVDENLPGTIADLDPEFLHDLRVAVRRSRSVLKEMTGVLDPDVAGQARTDLRWIQEVTGPTRDLDVMLLDWSAMSSPVPDTMAADLVPLQALLRAERTKTFATMRRQLRSRRFAVAWTGWRAVLDEGREARQPGPNAAVPVGETAGRRIVAVYRAMTKMGSAIDDSSPPEALHDLRKRGKELRYLLEMFGGIWPAERVKPLVGALKGLQDVLGHYQDDEIQVREVRSLGPALAATPGGTDSLIALGFVIEGLATSQAQARADFAARFAEFSHRRNRALVKDTFS